MSTFTLEIDTGNAAFDDGNMKAEIARILRDLANKIEQEGALGRYLFDINGNKVGASAYEGEDEDEDEGIDLRELRKQLNWMDRYQIQEILERYGFVVYDRDGTDSLREALFVNIEDGTIPAEELP